MSPKVLFISHDARRTGAPIWLLNFLKFVAGHNGLNFEVAIRDEGELLDDFQEISKTYWLKTYDDLVGWRRWKAYLQGRMRPKIRAFDEYLAAKALEQADFEIIYANTISNGELLDQFSVLNCKVITHVHELGHWISQLGERNLELVKQHTDRYVAASYAVKEHLVQHCDIPAEIVAVVQEFIPTQFDVAATAELEQLKRSLHLGANPFIVCGSGLETLRKGKDLFLDLALACQVIPHGRNLHFIWIGGWESRNEKTKIDSLIGKKKLDGRVHFIGEVSNPLDYFALSDLFALVSRDDPFPLVCLESASLGKPILCFRDAGGMPEFVEDDAGVCVDYLDVRSMAREVVRLMQAPESLAALGRRARDKVLERHDISTGSSQILDIIRKTAEGR